MKTTKLILGIISMVLSVLVLFQSCAAGLGNTLEANGEAGGSVGFLVAICLMVAGIVGAVTRDKGKGGPFTAAGFYFLGGLSGFMGAGSYGDLYIWSGVCIAFGLTFITGTIVQDKKKA